MNKRVSTGDLVVVKELGIKGYVLGEKTDKVMVSLIDTNLILHLNRNEVIYVENNKQLAFSNVAKVEITKEFTFDSAHHLLNYEGKCKFMHGHTYRLQVSFKGIPHHHTGMLIDFGDVKKMINEAFLDKLDHQVLNDYFSFNTTAENMVVFFYHFIDLVIKDNYDNVEVSKVVLWETPTSFATYTGEV